MTSITLPGAAGGGEVEVDLAAFPEHIREALALHGLQQKVADSVANAKAQAWTEAQCREKCQAVIDALMAGTWAKKASGPRATTETAYVIQKLMAKIKAGAKAKSATMDDDTARKQAEKILASSDPRAVAMVAALKAEWAAKKAVVDLSDII